VLLYVWPVSSHGEAKDQVGDKPRDGKFDEKRTHQPLLEPISSKIAFELQSMVFGFFLSQMVF